MGGGERKKTQLQHVTNVSVSCKSSTISTRTSLSASRSLLFRRNRKTCSASRKTCLGKVFGTLSLTSPGYPRAGYTLQQTGSGGGGRGAKDTFPL